MAQPCSRCLTTELCNCAPEFELKEEFEFGKRITRVKVKRDGVLIALARLEGRHDVESVANLYKHQRHRFIKAREFHVG